MMRKEARILLKRYFSSSGLRPISIFKLWSWMIANVLQFAFQSFIHAGDFRVSTAVGGSFRVGDGTG